MIKEVIKYGEAEVTYKSKQLLAEKPKLYNLFWETILRCNAKCKHCGSRAGENIKLDDELTTEEIKNALQSIDNKLEYHWEMTTNGILINESNIDKMKKTGMTTVSISLDGLEQSHDEFRGVKGSYSKIIENIKK